MELAADGAETELRLAEASSVDGVTSVDVLAAAEEEEEIIRRLEVRGLEGLSSVWSSPLLVVFVTFRSVSWRPALAADSVNDSRGWWAEERVN